MAKTKAEPADPIPAVPEAPSTPKPETIKSSSDKSQIYTGASLPGIKSHTVFKGKIPGVIDKPFIKELVIPLEKLSDFERKVKIKGSREEFCYKKSVELAAGLMEG